MIQLSTNSLSRLSDFVADRIGLYFPQERWGDLERGIKSASKEFQFADPESCIHWLLSSRPDRKHIEILSSYLTVGETFFFRDKRIFEVLQQEIFPELIRSRREAGHRLRIWSAACCTGEEPYSIAMLLDQLIPDNQNWNITILGTDINPRFLQKAGKATYSQWSFRETPLWIQQKYFKKTSDGHFTIHPFLTKRLIFSYLNLAEDSYPSLLNDTNAMDLIFCRNVLMYFAQDRAKRVIENLHRCLINGGWLIVSPAEASPVLFSKFKTVSYPGASLYQKSDSESRSAETISIHAFSQLPTTEIFAFSEPQNDPGQQSDFASYIYDAAEHTSEPVSADTPDSNSVSLLARACANEGKIEEARNLIEKAIESDKLNAAFHYLRSIILQEQGEINEAIESLKRAIYIDQEFVIAHFMLGTFATRCGRTKESERHFRSALQLLKSYAKEDILPESDGITAGRLIEIIESSTMMEEPV